MSKKLKSEIISLIISSIAEEKFLIGKHYRRYSIKLKHSNVVVRSKQKSIHLTNRPEAKCEIVDHSIFISTFSRVLDFDMEITYIIRGGVYLGRVSGEDISGNNLNEKQYFNFSFEKITSPSKIREVGKKVLLNSEVLSIESTLSNLNDSFEEGEPLPHRILRAVVLEHTLFLYRRLFFSTLL